MKAKILIIILALALIAINVSANPPPPEDCTCGPPSTYSDTACGTDADAKRVYRCDCAFEPNCLEMTCGWVYTGTTCSASEICQSGSCVACTSNCVGKPCGADDGCGNPCTSQVGACSSTGVCIYNSTIGDYACCTPNCAGKTCGSNGCGGTCPPGCTPPAVCNPLTSNCCTPVCSGTGCESNSCGGTCSYNCGDPNLLCDPVTSSCDLQVECNPECAYPACGDNDGCGNTC